MDILSVVLTIFIILELSNVLMLYLKPDTHLGNGMGIFKAYEKSKADPAVHALVTYLVNWVAGTKLIFIVLLIVIIITGNSTTRIFTIIALILSISTFFFRLYPVIRRMDDQGSIDPKGYSKTLCIMIAGFIVVFTIALIIYLINSHSL